MAERAAGFAALEVRTGKELWRWYVVPKPGDPGSETWKDDTTPGKPAAAESGKRGLTDPATKLYIVGTGNPFPNLRSAGAPGDNLYTDSAVALNVDTGKPAWNFQYNAQRTPGTTTRSACTCSTTRR